MIDLTEMKARLDELARAVVRYNQWRWMPGMRAYSPNLDRYWRVTIDPNTDELDGPDGGVTDWIPDLEDPATLGCLLALVRAAYNCPDIHIVPRTAQGTWHAKGSCFVCTGCEGYSEAEALVLCIFGTVTAY